MMGGDLINHSWFSSLWRAPLLRRGASSRPEKAMIGILSFEVATLMARVVNVWNLLGDRQINLLKEDLINSLGIKNLVSDDENLLIALAFSEILEDMDCIAKSVIRLAKRCSDPVYHRLEQVFNNPIDNVFIEWSGWDYNRKKMDKKVRKMDRFVAFTSQLHQEMDVLVELEQTLRRLQGSSSSERMKLLEFQHKVLWQRQEVKNLQDLSLWNRTHDFVVRLLAKSMFTLVERIRSIVAMNGGGLEVLIEGSGSVQQTIDILTRSHSLAHSSVHPSENHASIFYSGPMSISSSRLGLGSLKGAQKKCQQSQHRRTLSDLHKIHQPLLTGKWIARSGPFKGCMIGSLDSPIINTHFPVASANADSPGPMQAYSTHKMEKKLSLNRMDPRMGKCVPDAHLDPALPNTLGEAALSLHYANIIILIEKLASLPHLVGPDARDDLYNMLPTSIRNDLRAKLRYTHGKKSAGPTSLTCDVTLVRDWSEAMARILDWILPLAHNTVRWHSERNFEKQQMGLRMSVLLVQTLYFANRDRIEAVILELLVGLNYLCRCSKEVCDRAASGVNANAYLEGNIRILGEVN